MTDIVNVPAIPALPTPPSTNDPNHFAARADGFLGILPQWSEALDDVAMSAKTNASAAQERAAASMAAAAAANSNASEAAASADLAKNAPTTYGTSTDTLTLAAGSINFTVESGRAFVSGQAVVIAAVADPTSKRMYGIVTAYNVATGLLSITVSAFIGEGSISGWTITLGNAPNTTGLSVVTITANTNAAAGNYYVISSKEIILSMPVTPTLGDEIGFCNTSNGDVIVNWNGNTIKDTEPEPVLMILPRYGAAVVKYNGSTWS